MTDTRLDRLYNKFVDGYGDDVENVQEFIEALAVSYPEAEDVEIVDYVVGCVIDNNDVVEDYDVWVAEFAEIWGKK